jgi:hypothetical protein
MLILKQLAEPKSPKSHKHNILRASHLLPRIYPDLGIPRPPQLADSRDFAPTLKKKIYLDQSDNHG